MTPKKKPYERLGERASRGEFELVVPLDYKLLDNLVDEGTMLADLYEVGTSVKELGKMFPLNSTLISGRLTSLHAQGLTRKVKMVGSSQASWTWQRTQRGIDILNKWKEENGQK